MYQLDLKGEAFSLHQLKSSLMEVEVEERESGEEMEQKGRQFEA